jgi:CheY-like chemotaxis protein/anti-sigma regulatory factor (Ser/Thr protein kinase)
MRPSWESSMHATGRRIDVEFQLADEVLASGIAAEIREVLTNILLNAVQAMPNGGKIFVSTRRANGYASIDVRDTGTGMTDDVRKRIFDPFFTTKGVEGTGLGMSVAYGIVKRHNGQITIESIPDEGTTISISLPAAAPGSEVAGAEKLQRGRDSVEPVRILVVDDEEPLAQVFVDMLSEDGHIVCVAGSGRDAIDQFKKKPFDLVFTDLGMPEMSGWQVARGIKDIEPSTPVVLVTGWGTKVDENQLAESEIDMVLSKPVKIEDLSGAVSQVLAQKRRD